VVTDEPGAGAPTSGTVGDVVVWRRELLPTSETFVVNQMTSLTRWRPRLTGLRRVPSLLSVEPALVLTMPERVLMRRLGTSPRLHALLRRPQTRLVHAHFGPDASEVLTAARRARCPLVVTFHGYDITSAWSSLPAQYQRRWPDLMGYASQLIAVSDFIAERLLERGAPAEKVVVHHIGTPLPPSPVPRSGGGGPVLLFVGRLVEKKNCAGLLAAVAALPEPLRATPVRIVGDGPLRASLEQQAAALGLDVTFLGAVDAAGVAAEMRRATVFCSPGQPASNGDAEGLPITPLEAASHALPVVAGDSGGTRDAVLDGVTGRVVPPGQAALVEALTAVLADAGLAARLGAAGRRHIEEHFDLVRQTALLEDIYSEHARPAR
jgi:glycosyltransferase involved in cell wall biosynthesis